MDEREVECSRCDDTTIAIRDSIQSGWIYVGPGWEAIKGMIFCPKCKERYLKHRAVIGEHARKYPNLIMHPRE